MFNKLYVRFVLIFSIVALCVLIKACYPLKEGIDLAGGVDLVYELVVPPGGNAPELAKRVIETLQKRVDPYGQKNLTWRVVGKSRIEIQMPLATKETREARARYEAAEEALQATNLKPATMEVVFRAKMGAVDAARAARASYVAACEAAGLDRNGAAVESALCARNQAAGVAGAAEAEYAAAEGALQTAGFKPAEIEAALGARDRVAALDKLAAPGSAGRKLVERAAAAFDARASAAAKLAGCEGELAKLARGGSEGRGALDKAGEAWSALDKAKAAVEACDRELDKLAAPGSPRRKLLDEAAAAYDTLEKADAETRKYTAKQLEENAQNGIVAAKLAAEKAYNALIAKLMEDNIPLAQLNDLLEQGDNPKDTKAEPIIEGMLKKVTDPTQHERFAELIAARENLRAHQSGGFDDPNDLKRLLKGRGVLDFRIAASPFSSDSTEREAVKTAVDQFREVGPQKATAPNLRWFEIDPKNGADLAGPSSTYVTALAPDGNWYILLYTDANRALYHSTDRDWSLTDARVGTNMDGKTIVSFVFDTAGGNYFARLTTSNVHRNMAILLDDRVVSAPNINEPIITGRGEITFGDVGGLRSAEVIQKEAETLAQVLQAGSLPAALQGPVSETTMSPSFGEANIKAGELSGIIAVLAVMAFMLIYYTLTGSFADVALMINLLMTLAIMSLFGATLTLPGIAGIVLTLGMAVDANVLINERIREEVHRGSSLWMAVRQGYDKVFWTIFDANTTTSLTSIVLIFVGSAEVKGFGVTLLIGLMVHMFTALFITRTFMISAVKWGILRQIDDKSVAEYLYDLVTLTWLRKGEWPFMRVVTVSNFDWIGKRHIFWIVSGVLTVAGIIAFVKRGPDKYDTEFRSGTQVVFHFTPGPGHNLTLDQVRQRITGDMANFFRSESRSKGDRYDELSRTMESSNVVELGAGAAAQRQYKVVTAVSGIEDVKDFRDELVREFGDVLPNRPVIHFAEQDTKPEGISQLIDTNHTPVEGNTVGIIRPIDQRYLDEVFPGLHARSVAEGDLSDMRGGVAIYLQSIDPPATAEDLAERITRMRHQPDNGDARFRDCRVIPITYAAPATAPGTAPPAAAAAGPATQAATGPAPEPLVSSAVVVSADPNITYSADNEDQWSTNLAKSEWNIVRSALAASESLEDIQTVDSVVADTARTQAMLSVIISLGLIIIYVWIRFGGLRYGIGAILSLIHDAIMAVAATVLSGWIYTYIFGGKPNFFLVNDFKINLTMIAAYLTIIGYSVNDTIVIFDRIRENRGRAMLPLTAKLVNDSINQCFGRTIWTTFTVFIVVLIMYIWGGEGVHGFSYAMLIGVITGAYSTLAIASPALLSVKERARSKAEMAATKSPGVLARRVPGDARVS